MQFRLTAWLLAAFTAAAGFAGLPVTRTTSVRAPYEIVYVAREAKRAERRVAELPAVRVPLPQCAVVCYTDGPVRAIGPAFDPASFQRPPPPQSLRG